MKSYSINIKKEFTDYEDFYVENLHIYEKDGYYKSFIFKYNMLDDSKAFDLKTFTGDLEIYDNQENFQGVVQYENGVNRCVKIIIGDWVVVFWGNGSISVGHMGGTTATGTGKFRWVGR
ncbi:hypothetical protein [Flavobacterium sp. 3HN19-14]|uniref:hypothetical protein n=1 Tax=Flavobacterium sp. 3HN19-14 TaxID=3448133 RepID=UPI003EE036B3